MIDSESGVPVYRQLADIVRRQIECGELAPGQRLRTEPEYEFEYGISRASVRRAIAILRQEGLITTSRSGSRVRTVRAMAEVPIGDETRVTTRMPTEMERRQLGVPEGVPVFVVEQDGDQQILAGDRTALIVKAGRD
ncbi:GntR family transcriptional regulator [Nonomuraea sp. NPDC050310]|uniref:GntR family transcriptional regulator n=1 Tax=Nonomuraea sp. NPDC050310 TaxID=3154935 RepID=UPI0033ED74AE